MSILLSLLLIAGQQQPSTAAAAADKFALDLPVDDSVTAPADPAPTPAPAAVTATPAVGVVTGFSLDTPIAALIADPAAKAVLDRNLPGLSSDENLSKFEALSLRRLAPLSGGQLTGTLLTKVAYDLAALGGGAPPPKAKPSRRSLPSGR
ncbi:hypothetical protein M9979_04895 [Sphingomonas sp. RP10(2022)]|uniref:Uncharacterized protein n=1 Tax=Sphingomonas liriopis TaxID=2949094 RepID=A0A9X2HNF8_9SPHN|nr:hypothetical protein [Sphingomonas liriopis]MCP3734213.1 hypothetical protein [Sphingomonas liriopis]